MNIAQHVERARRASEGPSRDPVRGEERLLRDARLLRLGARGLARATRRAARRPGRALPAQHPGLRAGLPRRAEGRRDRRLDQLDLQVGGSALHRQRRATEGAVHHRGAAAERAAAGVPVDRSTPCSCEGAEPDEIALEDWLARGDPAFRAAPHAGATTRPCCSTPRAPPAFPKGVTLTHDNVATNIRTAAKCSGYSTARPARAVPAAVPRLRPELHHERRLRGRRDAVRSSAASCPMSVLEAIGRDRITKFFARPDDLHRAPQRGPRQHDLSSIDYYFSAAATMPEEISRRWTERFGRRVYEGYGLTECSPFACYNHLTEHRFGSRRHRGRGLHARRSTTRRLARSRAASGARS